ncbi:DUF2066 domain-containing protein [Rhodovibrionaceae bacterium A322]
MTRAKLADFCGELMTSAFPARLLCLAVLAFGLLLSPPVFAQSVFVVTGVEVDEQAESVSQAQKKALVAGRRAALERLWLRLVPAWAQQDIPPQSDEQISELVQSVGVGREQTSDVRYLAELAVEFKPDPVKEFLRSSRVPFAVTRSKPVVILPLFGEGENARLWEEPNDWRAAWSRRPASDGLVEIVSPLGDLSDVVVISSQQAREADLDALSSLVRRYDADRAYISRVSVQEVAPQDAAAAEPQASSESDAAASTQEVTQQAAEEATTTADQMVSEEAGGPQYAVTAVTSSYLGNATEGLRLDSFRSEPGESLESLLDRAVDKIASDIEAEWKDNNLLDYDQQNLMLARVKLSKLSDWIVLRRKIESIASVVQSQPRRLSRDEAILQIDYVGDSEQFARSLAQSDLALGDPLADEELQAFVHELRLSADAIELPTSQ